MLYYDRANVSEWTDINKPCKSKINDICHDFYFLDNDFKFQAHHCNGCDNFLMVPKNLNHIAIFNIKTADYR